MYKTVGEYKLVELLGRGSYAEVRRPASACAAAAGEASARRRPAARLGAGAARLLRGE